jgi:predicted DNA-binding transcriptional regulator YafY
MGEGDRAEPLERLLNLVGLLLETPRPLTFEEIRRVLEPYGQSNPDSAKRMFERDKDVLREFGVPLELVDVDVWGTEQGYVIPKDEYYLPEIEFEPGELVALLVAAQSGGRDPAAESGARKLLYGADGGVLAGLGGGPLASGSDARSNLVQAAAQATQELRRIRFPYRTSQGRSGERDVDAWAMVFRAGHWYLVGFDRVREDVRAFRLSRIVGEIADAGAGSAPPDGFRAADHVDAGPWVATGDDRAVVLFSHDRAWFAASQFPGAAELGPEEDGWIAIEIPMADEDAFAAMLLEYGPDAVVRSPASLRDAVVSRLEALVG